MILAAAERVGHLDGARRALLHALAVFNDLGVTSRLATVHLAYRLGLTRQSISTGRRGVRDPQG
ncbi:MAG TPA: hypothetical protein VFC03_06335 [Acidimicrobiales bacterium]|nr:hypothetical protein [Acidimicrobiales bacterium]